MAPTTGQPLTASPCEVRRAPILYDKRLPPQKQLRLLSPAHDPPFPTQLGHSLGQLHAVQHGVVHLKWVRDPSAGHARQFHTGSDPLLQGG